MKSYYQKILEIMEQDDSKTFNENDLQGLDIDKKNDKMSQTIYFRLSDDFNSSISLGESEYAFQYIENMGGIIVFSLESDSNRLSNSKLINYIKQKIKSTLNKKTFDRKINNIMNRHDDVFGLTVGNFFNGKFKTINGKMYNETSTSIEIIGVDTQTLNRVAKDVAIEFGQEAVLVRNYITNKTYIMRGF
jgi:hypothetical protein